jgi:flavin reductase (DIM6/NTAB) family NADH-FMN oxidoreductase RutF
MLFDFSTLDGSTRYKLMSQSIVPRPIAWIVTEDQVINIAPFSFYSGISSNPPIVMVAIGHKSDGTPKDTLRNLRRIKKCVVCSVLPEHLEPMHFSSSELAEHESEIERFNIPTQRILSDYPPIITGVPTAFFCSLYEEVNLEGSQTIPLFLKIDSMYLDDGLHNASLHFEFDVVARTGKGYRHLGEPMKTPQGGH